MSQEPIRTEEELYASIIMTASVAHEINRAFCQSIGDNSILPWDEAPEWQQQSAIDGVIFHVKNPDAGPDASHKNWMATRTRDGWVYGKEKNEELKMHPCMVPYDQLPREQQSKDYLFRATVHSVGNLFGLFS